MCVCYVYEYVYACVCERIYVRIHICTYVHVAWYAYTNMPFDKGDCNIALCTN